jgi:hypothetical protein
MHVLFSLSLIIMSGLLLGTVLVSLHLLIPQCSHLACLICYC